MNNEDNNKNDPMIEIDTKMIEAKQLVEQEELEKKKSVSIEEVKKLIEDANQQANVARELFSVLQHPVDRNTLLCRIRIRKQRSKHGKTRVSKEEYYQDITLVVGFSDGRYLPYMFSGTRYEFFEKNWFNSVEGKCKEVEPLRRKAKQ
ncbi:unnamed protein product, partial [Mesorhabditis belari]|uniref:Uncharacterized protein n=1 Tax=Mesorhabditis belari TaxID=2138241 RepID=A0AAF3J1K8_9BILA